jgi:hypothetical protein
VHRVSATTKCLVVGSLAGLLSSFTTHALLHIDHVTWLIAGIGDPKVRMWRSEYNCLLTWAMILRVLGGTLFALWGAWLERPDTRAATLTGVILGLLGYLLVIVLIPCLP